MAYTLEDLAGDIRAALQADPGRDGQQRVVGFVRRALADSAFIDRHLGAGATAEREILYEDPALGFCICAHSYQGAKHGKPHDHGPTWAVYGQALGETEMSDWRLVAPPADGRPGTVEQVRSYRMRPGDAHLYTVGDIHAPMREDSTRLLRVEGRNTDTIERTPLRAAHG